MLPLQFFGQNLHFIISLLAALVCFAVFWLYFDAWTTKKQDKELFKWGGFLLVSVSFVVEATIVEQSFLSRSIFGDLSRTLAEALRLTGFIGIIIGLIIDPLQPKPDNKGLEEEL